MYDKVTQSNEKSFSVFPRRLHQTKYRERRYPCFSNKLIDFAHTEGTNQHLGLSISACDLQYKHKMNYMERAHQKEMGKKNSGVYSLQGLQSMNSNRSKAYIKVNNSESVLSAYESLTAIKTMLIKTNDKLDLILKTLLERYSYKSKEQNKHKNSKPNGMRSKTSSVLILPTQNGFMDLPSVMKTQSHCSSTTHIPKLKSRESSSSNSLCLSPYNTSYYMFGSNIKYFNKPGTKHPENIWNPFIFLAANVNTKDIKLENGTGKILQDCDTKKSIDHTYNDQD